MSRDFKMQCYQWNGFKQIKSIAAEKGNHGTKFGSTLYYFKYSSHIHNKTDLEQYLVKIYCYLFVLHYFKIYLQRLEENLNKMEKKLFGGFGGAEQIFEDGFAHMFRTRIDMNHAMSLNQTETRKECTKQYEYVPDKAKLRSHNKKILILQQY